MYKQHPQGLSEGVVLRTDGMPSSEVFKKSDRKHICAGKMRVEFGNRIKATP